MVDGEVMDTDKILFLVTTSVVKSTPKWGQRAYSAIFDNMMNGIIYMMPTMPTGEELATDWRVQMMSQITQYI